MAFGGDNPTKYQLLEMGYNEYMVDQSFKYINQENNDNLLLDAMDWLNNHEITEHETKRNNLIKICTIIECTKYQALHALKQSQNNFANALDLLVNANLNTSIIANNNNNQQDNIFSNLSQQQIQELELEVNIGSF